MYKATFISDDGRTFEFDHQKGVVFDMDLAEGLSVELKTTQGFLQIGESVGGSVVDGRDITVKGYIYKDIVGGKNKMRSIFSPFSAGRLVIDGKYEIRVCVKDMPSFSPSKENGRFEMRLFAPYPFFNKVQKNSHFIGRVEPSFSFPVNYAEPHYFGVKGESRVVSIYNDGDVNARFSLRLECFGESTNPTITNLKTFDFLRLNGTLNAGDIVNVYRTDRGVLRVDLERNGEIIDAISWVDEESTLLELYVGENLIAANDDEGGANLFVQLIYSPVAVSVYED